MALFQVLKFDGPANVLVWKHPKTEMNTGSQLVVGPAQEAVFVRGGNICDVLGPGSHTLDTSNLPVLSGLIKLPFGRRSPFTAEVFFVNKLDVLDVKWGTARHIQLRDPVYHVAIPLRAFGQYGIRIADGAQFLRRLSGAVRSYTAQDLADYFRGVLGSRIVEELSRYLLDREICFLEANAHLSEIGAGVNKSLEPIFSEYGITLVNFCINSINAPEGDASVKKLREVLDRRHEMDALRFSYQQDRSFDVLEEAAQNLGGGTAGLGAALGSVLSDMVRDAVQPAAGTGQRFCSGCGTAIGPDGAFCSKCGKPAGGAAFCPRCGAAVQPEDLFCGKCGQPLGTGQR